VPSNGVRERAASFAAPDAPWFTRLLALTSAEAGARVAQQPIVAQYTAALSAIARERPLMLILEDLHWVDSASSGLLFHLSREAAHSRMLILGTYRPDEVAVSRGEMAHPLAEMLSELKRQHGDIWLDLGELAEADGRHFVETYLDTQPNRLGAGFREALFNRTGGHALFTVELLVVFRPYQLALLAEAYQTVGEPAAGLALLAEAVALVEQTEERFWEAEIYRLKGELLLKVEGAGLSQGVVDVMQDAGSPEGCFLKAIEIARRQEGKSLELRATVSLGRLWRQQGKQDQARRMLADIYGWFTEGFDTIDLQQARALLQELSA